MATRLAATWLRQFGEIGAKRGGRIALFHQKRPIFQLVRLFDLSCKILCVNSIPARPSNIPDGRIRSLFPSHP